MGKSKVGKLLMASITIMLCMVMLLAGTYALWSDKVTVSNHLEAGTLSLKLERTALRKTMLDNGTGYMKMVSDTDTVDFTANGYTGNVFGIADGELVVPTSCYEATMKLTNNGSVAFKYDIIIELKTEHNTTDEITDLARQLKVWVDAGDADGYDNKGFLSEFITTAAEDDTSIVGGKIVISSNIVKNAETSFKVKIEFVNDDDVNNAAMDKEASFDLIVKAVQLTSNPAASDG